MSIKTTLGVASLAATVDAVSPGLAHILVFSQRPSDALIVNFNLQLIGCSCDVVTTFSSAVRSLRNRHYDAVLIDMPPRHTLRFANFISRYRPDFPRRARLIVVGPEELADEMQTALSSIAVDGFVTKPCHPAILARMLGMKIDLFPLMPESRSIH